MATVTLKLVKGHLDRDEFVFDERTTCVLGRADDCVPRLPSDDHHRTVSRHHCLLDINPPDVRIRDFGSLNGTYVNGKKIGQRAKGQTPEEAAALSYPEHDLADGDEIKIGETVFRVAVAAVKRTLVLATCATCAKCGREVGGEVGDRAGEYVCLACQAEPDSVLKVLLDLARSGQRDVAPIAGYVMVRELGRGGMGAVYLARHEATGAEVALKVMLPKVAAEANARIRFLREVELTRNLRHPNIAALYDAGSSGGSFYFTSEYCAGGSLDQVLDRAGPLPVEDAVRLVRQALAGLGHAHEQGVVHRDLSPQNLLLGVDDRGALVAKVADFGLAKAFDQAGLSGLTRTGTTAGKPWYMPRQQVINFRNASPAVDVWAMAACLYRLLTGQYPREFPLGKDPWQVVLQAAPVPIRQRRSDVPSGLAVVVDKALQERPGIGFQTAEDFRRALRVF